MTDQLAVKYAPIFVSERSRYSHFVPWRPARAYRSYHTHNSVAHIFKFK